MGNTTSYSYNLAGGTTTFPFAGGDTNPAISEQQRALAGPTPTFSTSITINFPDSGVRVVYQDAYGMVLAETDALGKTSFYTYDANHKRLTGTDELG